MNAFTKKVIASVKQIPKGKIATYGQIAKIAGKPHGARGVGWILNSCSKKYRIPWQRVINSKGKISFHRGSEAFVVQRHLLQKEGIEITPEGALDLEIYQWRKDVRRRRKA